MLYIIFSFSPKRPLSILMKTILNPIPSSSRLSYEKVAIGLSLIVALVGTPTIFNLHTEKIFSAWLQMQINTALLMMALGTSLILYFLGQFKLANFLGLIVLIFGSVTLAEHLFNIELGIDQLFRESKGGQLGRPGLMAQNTALAFVMLGFALSFISQFETARKFTFTAGVFASLGAGLGLIKIFSGLFSLSGSYDTASFSHMPLPTAIGISIAGGLLIAHCILLLKRSKNESYRLVPLYVTVLLIFGNLLLWQVQLDARAEYTYKLVTTEAENMKLEILERLRQSSLAIKGLGSRIEYFGLNDKTYLTLEAKSYIEHLIVFKRIGIIDEHARVVWSYPPELEDQIKNFDQAKNSDRNAALKESRTNREPSMSRSIDLKSGGKGFILPVPLIKNNQLLGYVYASIEAPKLFQNLSDSVNFQVKVSDQGEDIFVETKSDATQINLQVTSQFKWGFANLKLEVVPTNAFLNRIHTQSLLFILLGGGFLTLILGAFLQSKALIQRNQLKFTRHEKLIHDRLERVIEATGEGILELEFTKQHSHFIDSQAKRIFGFEENEDPTYEEILTRIHPHDRYQIISEVKRFFRAKIDRFQFEFKILGGKSKDSTIWARAKGKIIETNGQANLLVATISDITQGVEARLQLQEALKKAEAGTIAKSAFLATMSHEIRTPLNGIIGMTDLLLDTNLDSHQKKYAEIVQHSGANLLALINDVLDFSKIEANKLEFENEPFHLVDLIESQVEVLVGRATNQKITIMTFVSPRMPQIHLGDAGKIGQILINLVSNAIKFTKYGGVSVRAFERQSVPERPGFSWIRFEVEDTGIGLSAEGKLKLFKPFSQVDGGANRKYGGTGLGLSISKRLAEGMGGAIGVESSANSGSIFWFEIPLQISPNSYFLRPNIEVQNPKKYRVLIVDEDPIAQNILLRYADSFGLKGERSPTADLIYHLTTAKQRRNPFQIVILAAGTNPESVFLLAKSAREALGSSTPKLLLAIEFDRSISLSEVRTSGFENVLHKPFKQAALTEIFTDPLIANHATTKVSPTEPPPSLDLRVAASYLILVADDLSVNRMLTQKILESLGHRTEVAENGLVVLEAIKKHNFDLILMDCQMPELDGFGATAAIRQIEKSSGRHMPIVALTANAMDGDSKRCTDAGMDDYLSKPIKKDKLKSMLEKWLSPVVKEKIAG